MDALHLPLVKSWKLNERHYGALQGLSKVNAVKQHGRDTVQRWRRDYDYPPPAVDLFDKRHPAHERKYKGIPNEQLPTGEVRSLIVRV
jgi:2,3-bisphosphoglycerate-dependent phosphoglycerate mutase